MAESLCPNCGDVIEDHPENGCVLAALIGVLHDRGHDTAEVNALWADIDTDALWNTLGKVVDDIAAGAYGGGALEDEDDEDEDEDEDEDDEDQDE